MKNRIKYLLYRLQNPKEQISDIFSLSCAEVHIVHKVPQITPTHLNINKESDSLYFNFFPIKPTQING